MPPSSLADVWARGRGLARRAARSPLAQRVAQPRPALSVIVPFYNVEPYLAECLDSIRDQSFEDIEVILVDDGSPDGSRRIAEEYAAADPRFRVVVRENGGLGAARNTGVREARGHHLTFVDSDDVLPPHALRRLMASAAASGSDIVVGAVDRFNSLRRWQPGWVEEVQSTPRTGITIDQHTPLLRNLYTWDKVFRRDFWDEQDLWFREGVAYEDQPIVTQLFARASAIDVLPDVVYLYRSRDDNSSISQQTATLADLRARVLAWQVSRDTLRAELSPPLYDDWLGTLFATHFHWYLTSKGTVDDDYWAELVAAIRDFAADASPAVWDRTEPAKRVLIELTRQDRRADAQEFVRQGAATNTRKWPSEVRDDGVLLRLPFVDDPTLDDRLFLIRPEQLELVHTVEKFSWHHREDETVVARLAGWAYLTKVDLSRVEATTEVLLRNERTGEEAAFEATDHPPTAFPPPVDDVWCDYAPGTFGIDLPVAQVLARGEPGDVWRAWVRIAVGEFTVTSPLSKVLRNSGAGAIPAHTLDDGRRLVPVWAAHRPLGFRREQAGTEVRDVAVDARELVGRVADEGWREGDEVEVSAGPVRAGAPIGPTGEFRVELPTGAALVPGQKRTWKVRVQHADGTAAGLVPSVRVPDTVGTLGPATNRLGELVVTEWGLGAEVHGIVVREDGTIRVRGRVHGGVTALRLVVSGLKARGEGPTADVTEGSFEAVLELEHELFRFGRLPIPWGDYDVLAEVRTGDAAALVELPVRVAVSMGDRLPVPVDTGTFEGRIVRGPESRLRITLVRPLGPARGRYQQHLLRTTPRPRPIERCLLVRSYFGEQATDHGVSVHAELRRRGSDLPVYWTVHDYGVPVPEGGIPVVWNSREWFDVLAGAKYYLDNMYQPDYHRKPEGQVIIQTFHGYPFKQMGHSHWKSLQFSQAKIDSYDERTAQWDYVVSPARYATDLLRREFGYRGEVLEIGYPRNDVLLSPDADRIRAATRASLGLADGQTAVLYAPTFRDYLSNNDKSALMTEFLDFDRATRALGDDVVFLVRGHAFNARVKRRMPRSPGRVDVTDYPEVADLLLAADAAVVDYSSLRFDFGVTGKPMVFHVPDLERYRDTRGWLFDFEATAPGPLVATTDEVVRHLGDLDGLRQEYAAAYASFRADYLDLEDGHAGRRLVDAVFAPRGDA